MDSLLNTLQLYGLTEKEAKVYMTSLSMGAAPASSIARYMKLPRSTVYSILQQLCKKGVINELKKNAVIYFSPISPKQLFTDREKKYTLFKEQLPEFMAIAEKIGTKPKVQFFEGIEGLKSMYQDLLTSEFPILSFLGVEHINKEFQKYLNKHFLPDRIKKNIYAKVILSHSPKNLKYVSVDTKAKKESKVITDSGFSIDGEINIYGPNKVAISLFTDTEMTGLVIYSEKLYNTLSKIFQYMRDN